MFTDSPNITESLSGRNKTSETQIYIGFLLLLLFLLVQSPRCVWLFVTPWTAAPQAPLSSTFSWSLLKFMSTELVMLSNHLIPLSPSSPPALSLSQNQGLLQWVSSSHQVVKVLELQLQHQSFQWIFRVDFPRIDWFDLLAVQGTQKRVFSSTTVWKYQFFSAQPPVVTSTFISQGPELNDWTGFPSPTETSPSEGCVQKTLITS